jgi:hypothetical protein
MATSLRSNLNHLASSFADAVLEAIRAASLEELLTESGAPRGRAPGMKTPHAAVAGRTSSRKASGRLPRRSPAQIAKTVEQVVGLVKKHKEGLRAEQIRMELGLLAKEMPRVLKEGLAARKLAAKGQKRATTYFAK